MATRNGQAGVVKNGKVIINYAYQSVEYDDYNHVFILKRSSKIGVADQEGIEIIPVEYEQINVKGIYLQAIGFDGITTYFDAKGNKIEDNQYESVLRTQSPNYWITINAKGKYGIMNPQGQVILDNTYRYLEYLYEDYFIASNEEGYLGIINNLGDVVVDFQYEVLQKVDNTNLIEAKILKENKTDLYSSKLEKIDTKQNVSIYPNEKEPEYIGPYHKVYYGYGESYYTKEPEE